MLICLVFASLILSAEFTRAAVVQRPGRALAVSLRAQQLQQLNVRLSAYELLRNFVNKAKVTIRILENRSREQIEFEFDSQMCGVMISFSIFTHLTLESELVNLLGVPNKFADFTYLGSVSSTNQNVVVITVFLAWVKLFKYIFKLLMHDLFQSGSYRGAVQRGQLPPQ